MLSYLRHLLLPLFFLTFLSLVTTFLINTAHADIVSNQSSNTCIDQLPSSNDGFTRPPGSTSDITVENVDKCPLFQNSGDVHLKFHSPTGIFTQKGSYQVTFTPAFSPADFTNQSFTYSLFSSCTSCAGIRENGFTLGSPPYGDITWISNNELDVVVKNGGSSGAINDPGYYAFVLHTAPDQDSDHNPTQDNFLFAGRLFLNYQCPKTQNNVHACPKYSVNAVGINGVAQFGGNQTSTIVTFDNIIPSQAYTFWWDGSSSDLFSGTLPANHLSLVRDNGDGTSSYKYTLDLSGILGTQKLCLTIGGTGFFAANTTTGLTCTYPLTIYRTSQAIATPNPSVTVTSGNQPITNWVQQQSNTGFYLPCSTPSPTPEPGKGKGFSYAPQNFFNILTAAFFNLFIVPSQENSSSQPTQVAQNTTSQQAYFANAPTSCTFASCPVGTSASLNACPNSQGAHTCVPDTPTPVNTTQSTVYLQTSQANTATGQQCQKIVEHGVKGTCVAPSTCSSSDDNKGQLDCPASFDVSTVCCVYASSGSSGNPPSAPLSPNLCQQCLQIRGSQNDCASICGSTDSGGTESVGNNTTGETTYPPVTNYPFKPCSQVQTAIGRITTNPYDFINYVFGLLLGLSGGIALLIIIYHGYRLMISQGNPDAVKKAREGITAGIIGIIFAILSTAILEVIGVNILKLPGFTQ